MTVRFNLADADGDALHVTLSLYADNGNTFLMQCTNTDPPPGTAFTVGTDRTIIWNAQAEYPGHAGSEYVLKVVADDGFVTTPEGFVLVPPGTFMMGSPMTELSRVADETRHQVTLTDGFYMQTTGVTNQQFRDMAQWAYDQGYVTVTNNSLRDNLDGSTQLLKRLGDSNYEIAFSAGVFSCTNPTHPVNAVPWYGAVAYCDWLSLQQNLPRAYSHITWQCNAGNPYHGDGVPPADGGGEGVRMPSVGRRRRSTRDPA